VIAVPSEMKNAVRLVVDPMGPPLQTGIGVNMVVPQSSKTR
jgi:hypothetical protein